MTVFTDEEFLEAVAIVQDDLRAYSGWSKVRKETADSVLLMLACVLGLEREYAEMQTK